MEASRPGISAARVLLLGAALICASPGVALAQQAVAPTRPSDTPVPSCLDESIKDQLGATLKPRGVQKRDFLKDGELELVARGGVFAGDLLSTSYVYGGALAVWFTEDVAIEATFDVTPVKLDLDAPLAEFFGDDRFEADTGYLGMAGFAWSPIHAKLKMFGGIVHSDLIFVAGGGRMFGADAVQGLAFDGGMVLELFTSQWVTFRIDIRDIVMLQEAVSETRLTNNITVQGGIGLWLPVGL